MSPLEPEASLNAPAPSSVRWLWASPPDAAARRVAADLAEGRVPPDAEVLKSNRARTVWRVPTTAGGVILKHFKVPPRDRRLFLLRPSRARREYRVMEAFCRLGLPTVRPLAFAERWASGGLVEAWFIGRLVPDATTLADRLKSTPSSERGAMIRQGLRLVAQMHRHPYFHRDLHAENILLTTTGEMLITDLHTVWRVPRLTRRIRVANLARLMFSIRDVLRLDEVPGYVRYYAECVGCPWDHLVGPVMEGLDAFERDHVRGRTARCVRNGSRFTRARVEEDRLFLRTGYGRDDLERDLAAPGFELAAHDAPSGVRRVSGPHGDMVVKHFSARGLWGRVRQHLGRGRARSAWIGARRLEVIGVDTPPGMALLECADGSAQLVTRALDAAVSLRALLTGWGDDPAPCMRRRVASAVGHAVGCLARSGSWHHDLSAKNVLIVDEPVDGIPDLRFAPPVDAPRVFLIDLDNMSLGGAFRERELSRMLGQIGDVPPWITRTDKLRFVRAYERVAGRSLTPGVVRRAQERTRRRQARRAARLAMPAAT